MSESVRLELRVRELQAALRSKHEAFLEMLDRLQEREEEAVKRARAQLERSEARYRLVAGATHDFVRDWDLETGEAFWSEAIVELLGCRPEEAGTTVSEAKAWWLSRVHPEDRRTVEAAFARVLSGTEELLHREYRVRRQDGSYATVLDRARAARNRQGRAVRLTGSILDTTERNAYERQLEETAVELEVTVDELQRASAEAIAARDAAEAAERRMTFLAEAGAILAGSLEYEETLGSLARLAVPYLADVCLIDLLEPDGRFRRLAMERRGPSSGEASDPRLERFGAKPGAPVGPHAVMELGEPLLLREVSDQVLRASAGGSEPYRMAKELGLHSALMVPLTSREGALGAATLLRGGSARAYGEEDLELARELAHRAAAAIEHARLYEAALVANQAKADFLAVMSHELRTPLNAILGYADLLLHGIPSPVPEPSGQQVERIRSAAAHLLELIEQILVFARIEAGQEQVQPTEFDLVDLARDTAAWVEPLAAGKGLTFRVLLPEEGIAMVSDLGKLRQILLNLLSNAVKFTERGSIELRVDPTGAGARIEVADTGIGIAREHRESIFDPFSQVEEPTRRERGGTGLGLSVSRHLARLLGGEIAFESEVGRGTTFVVELPRVSRAPGGKQDRPARS